MLDFMQIVMAASDAADKFVDGATTSGDFAKAGPATTGETYTTFFIFIGICALVLVILHIFIAVWLFKDAKAKGKQAGGWAFMGAIPLLGLVVLFIYALSGSGGGASGTCPVHGHPFVSDSNKCHVCMLEEQKVTLTASQTYQGGASMDVGMGAQGDIGGPPPTDVPGMPEQPQPGGAAAGGTMLASAQPDVAGEADGSGDEKSTAVSELPPRSYVQLLQVNGQRRGQSFMLQLEDAFGKPVKNIIGRSAKCDLSIPEDDDISNRHCSMGAEEDGSYYIKDLDSTNGTFIQRGGQRVAVHKAAAFDIQDGDVMEIGKLLYRIIITKTLPPEEKAYVTPGDLKSPSPPPATEDDEQS